MKVPEYCKTFCFYCVIILTGTLLNSIGTHTSGWIKVDSCDFNHLRDSCCRCQQNLRNNTNTIDLFQIKCTSSFDTRTGSADDFPELFECLTMVKYTTPLAGLQYAAFFCYVVSATGFFAAIVTNKHISEWQCLCVCAISFVLYHLGGLLSIIGCIVLSTLHPDATLGYSFYLCITSAIYTLIQIFIFWTFVIYHYIQKVKLSTLKSPYGTEDDQHTVTNQNRSQGNGPISRSSVVDFDGRPNNISTIQTYQQHVSMAGAQVHLTGHENLSLWSRSVRFISGD